MNSATLLREAFLTRYTPWSQLMPLNEGVTSIDWSSRLKINLLEGFMATVWPFEVDTKSMAPEYSMTEISSASVFLTVNEVPFTSM